MRPLLLDTTVLIDVLRGRGAAERLRAMRSTEPVPYICAINVEELWRGTREDEQGHVGRLLRSLRLAPLGFAEGAQAGRWRRDFAAEGITLSQADCLIAAAALGAGTAFRDRKPEALPHARARRRALAGQRLSGQVGPRPERSLVEHPGCRQDSDVQPESVVYREEVTAMLFAIADMNRNIRSIRDLLEEEHGGEEELPEDDA